MPQLIPFSLTHMNLFQMCSRACQDYTSVSLLAESLLSPPTSPTPRETGGVDGAEMDEEQFFFFPREWWRDRRRPEAPNWEDEKNLKTQRWRRTERPYPGCGSTHIPVQWVWKRRAAAELITKWHWLGLICWDDSYGKNQAYVFFSPFSPPFPFPEILRPPIWQLLKLYVHLTPKDPANMPLPLSNQRCFLGSLAAFIYLEDRLLIQRDWDARWGGKRRCVSFKFLADTYRQLRMIYGDTKTNTETGAIYMHF